MAAGCSWSLILSIGANFESVHQSVSQSPNGNIEADHGWKSEWYFHLPPKSETWVKFELCRLLGGLATECNPPCPTVTSAKLMLLWLSWAGACVEQLKSSYLTFSILYKFLDEMNYSFTQIDRANPETQHSDTTHLNPYAGIHLKFPNPDSPWLNTARSFYIFWTVKHILKLQKSKLVRKNFLLHSARPIPS